jgi:hypothetical protein
MQKNLNSSVQLFSAVPAPRIEHVFMTLSTAGFSQWPQDEEDLLRFFTFMLDLLQAGDSTPNH